MLNITNKFTCHDLTTHIVYSLSYEFIHWCYIKEQLEYVVLFQAIFSEIPNGISILLTSYVFWRCMILNDYYGRFFSCVPSPVEDTYVYSPWATGDPHAPPPHPPPLKKLGLTTNFGQILRFPISRKLLHVGSWFWCLNLYFLGALYSMADQCYVCKRTKNMKKSPRWPPISLYFGKCVITSVLVAIRRWFWCLNQSFHVWGFQ